MRDLLIATTNTGRTISFIWYSWLFASSINAERDEDGKVLLYEDAKLTRVHRPYIGHKGQLYCKLITDELPDVPCLYAIVVDDVIVYSGRDMNSLRNRFSSSFMIVSESEKDEPNGTNARINHLICEELNHNHIVELYYKPYDRSDYSSDEEFHDMLRRAADETYDLFDEPEWVLRRPIYDDD